MPYCLQLNLDLMIIQLAPVNLWLHEEFSAFIKSIFCGPSDCTVVTAIFAVSYTDHDILYFTIRLSVSLLNIFANVLLSVLSGDV